MKIGDQDYCEQLQKFFEQVGPNPGTNMASKWAWSITQEKEFQKKLREAGELTEIKREKLPS